jgi:diaminohydroxyphosphoribosylaminopyrimidine deaminase/5-amino-6-(5-phosphoribosylamino)uracil reductase
MTNILFEGGASLLGSLFDAKLIDEVHVFMAPKLFGGQKARSPIRGAGVENVGDALKLEAPQTQVVGDDVHVWGSVRKG